MTIIRRRPFTQHGCWGTGSIKSLCYASLSVVDESVFRNGVGVGESDRERGRKSANSVLRNLRTLSDMPRRVV